MGRIEEALKYIPAMVKRHAHLKPWHTSWEEACQEAAVALCRADTLFEEEGPAKFSTFADRVVKHHLWKWTRKSKYGDLGIALPLESEVDENGDIHPGSEVEALESVYIQAPTTPEDVLLKNEDWAHSRRRAMQFISDLPREWRDAAETVVWQYNEPTPDFRTLAAITRYEPRTDIQRAREVWAKRPERYKEQWAEWKRARQAHKLALMTSEERAKHDKTEEHKAKLKYAKLCRERAARRQAKKLTSNPA